MIKIICVGKIKEKFYREALAEYQKRLSKYTKLEIIEVPDFDSKTPSIELEKEKESIVRYIGERDYIIALDIDGKQVSSISLAEQIEKIYMQASTITFIIGGSSGIHPEVKQKAHLLLSFSKMTFPHQLFRVILLEQLYRSYKIMHHESYHK
ncbi:MAG: 23S rRNA (pseudouridine(1915)-N(3))-methyltransferase RlmH [Bacilli bacterium]|nr:23S rRNA (pseudouridine(1915)-N(3))-methyltransferase RlmH [Bacilli bacterium]